MNSESLMCLVFVQAMVTGYTIPQRSKPPRVVNGTTHSSEDLQHDSRATDATHNARFQTRPSSAPYQRSPTPPPPPPPPHLGHIGGAHPLNWVLSKEPHPLNWVIPKEPHPPNWILSGQPHPPNWVSAEWWF